MTKPLLLLTLLLAMPAAGDPHALNTQRRALRFAEGQASGALWMVECRDLWDASDADGGVYFSLEESNAAVRNLIVSAQAQPNDIRVLGIYSLGQELLKQGPGLRAEQFLELYRAESNLP